MSMGRRFWHFAETKERASGSGEPLWSENDVSDSTDGTVTEFIDKIQTPNNCHIFAMVLNFYN